jgi:hypothetical protein
MLGSARTDCCSLWDNLALVAGSPSPGSPGAPNRRRLLLARRRGRHCGRLFNSADGPPAATPFAQKCCSIPLDTYCREAQDHFVVSPIEARPPLRSSRAVSLNVKLRTERQEGSTSSACSSPLTRRLTLCPTDRTARPRSSGSRPHHSSPTRILRGPFLLF